MAREAVIGYLRSLFHGRLQRTPSYAWSSLACAVADLPAPELLDEVREAYADGLVDTTVADLEGIERDVAAPKPWRLEQQHLTTDAIAEMEWWACFQPEDSRPNTKPAENDIRLSQLPPALPTPAYVSPQPFVSEPKIGRNEPCPCGSGKKYKKCCAK